MRIPALLLPLVAALAFSAVACNWMGGTDCSTSSNPDYDGCPDPYGYHPDYSGYGSSGYGSSGGGTPDASKAKPTCPQSFTFAVSIPPESGDCQLVLERTGGSYADAVYFVAEPEAGATSTCEVLDGPSISQCSRVNDVVTVSASAAETTAVSAELMLQSWDSSFTTTLWCAHAVHPLVTAVNLQCAAPTEPGTPDAGVTPDAAPADDAGDAEPVP
jgi:hypothetical protein